MGWRYDEHIEELETIDEVCKRALEELDEEWPWVTILRKCIERIQDLNKQQ